MKALYEYSIKDIETLIPYANNARTHSEKQVEQLAASIKKFGFTNPILIDPKKGIIAGHGRVLAAKEAGMTELPCIIIKGLSKTKKKALIIADNQLALNAGWDLDILKDEINQIMLDEPNLDIDLMGFDEDFINDLLDEDEDNNPYTTKIESPSYKPSDKKPKIKDLFDKAKYTELVSSINSSNATDEEKVFLKAAAQRHLVFNYQKIADFYAHSDKHIQELMEDSALVIIDFKKAIEKGYVKLSDEIQDLYGEEYD